MKKNGQERLRAAREENLLYKADFSKEELEKLKRLKVFTNVCMKNTLKIPFQSA